MERKSIGISGLAAYTPPFRVWLEDWCNWTDNQWPKIREVVGRSFRVRGRNQSVYTMAATAVMRLIEQYDIDPARVKFLGLGTESSTDNSAGAIIVKGMVDQALIARGKAPIARSCEVPEFKHACLGGVYATSRSMGLADKRSLFAPTSRSMRAARVASQPKARAQLRCCSKKILNLQKLI